MRHRPVIPSVGIPQKVGAANPARSTAPNVSPTSGSLTANQSNNQGVPRIGYRLDEVAAMFGLCRRTLERSRSAGSFPPPDRKVGKIPLWRLATIERWFDEGGAA